MKISQDNVTFGAGGAARGSNRQPRSILGRVFDVIKRLLASLLALIIVVIVVGFIHDVAGEIPQALKTAKNWTDETRQSIELRQKERQDRAALGNPKRINPAAADATVVSARAWGPSPGPLICKSLMDLQRYMLAYGSYWSSAKRSEIMKGQDILILGEVGPAPDPYLYGCIVVEAGTKLWLDPNTSIPVVTTQFADGTYVKGITMEGMVQR